MLTSETKQKINNCRDYLVGKIPDPKWQIDQITNALIYKFMSDQDRLAKEIGWNASFFVDQWEKESEKYEKYSWEHLFDTKLTNEAKAKLYIDGIEQLSKAKHLPELFRDIFKNAFLPFRDSNTIVLFLTEINKFDYHHSEELWNAFEYLLSIMGSQWNAGQFRTPRHIIEFLVDVVDPKPGETIYDPACGTAGFLISAFTHIMENNPKLSVPEKLELYKNISWVDIDPGMAKIARVNLYLHWFKTPKISEDDTLSNIKLWENKYDVILANPPFMTPKWGIKVHEWYSIKSTKAEVLFTDYIAEHLRLKWRAGIIVPEGIIFQSANAYKDLRKMLVEQNLLYSVVSLPSWIFQPYSWVKTSILFLDRELASKTDKVLFVKVENDGYDLWAQRREINKNDLPKSLEILKKYKTSVLENKNFETEDKNVLVVEKSKIAQNCEYNLSWERYRENISLQNSDFEMMKLSKLVEIKTWKKDVNSWNENWKYPFFTCAKEHTFSDEYSFDTEALLIAWNGDVWSVKYFKWKFEAYQRTYVLSDFINVLPKYLYVCLDIKLKETVSKLKLWNTMPYIKLWMLQDFKIPLPSLEIQEQIVEELDNFQKIINGAKQIVENYKPKIKIDESWEVVELGEVCTLIWWWTPSRTEEKYWGWKIPWISSRYFSDDRKIIWSEFITEEWLKNSSTKIIPKDSIIIITRVSVWKFAITDKDYAINQDLTGLIPWVKILNKFLLYISESIAEEIKMNARWMWVVWVNRDFVSKIKIPLPPLEIQEQIVAKIEEEQKMVESAKWLIEVFENKIKERIWEVWGENLDDNI